MGYRNSVLTPVEKFYIPDDDWEKFCSHTRKVSHFLLGNATITSECVRFDYSDSESLTFYRNMESQFRDGPEYIIHKNGRDFRFAMTISAMFLLFRQDCLKENPEECRTCGDFLDAQAGLERLREAGVWEGGEKCLLCLEDLHFDNVIKEYKEKYLQAWDENPNPKYWAEKLKIEVPYFINGERNQESWRAYIKMKVSFDGIYKDRFNRVKIKQGEDEQYIFFPTRQMAEIFAREKSVELGIPITSEKKDGIEYGTVFSLPKPAENIFYAKSNGEIYASVIEKTEESLLKM